MGASNESLALALLVDVTADDAREAGQRVLDARAEEARRAVEREAQRRKEEVEREALRRKEEAAARVEERQGVSDTAVIALLVTSVGFIAHILYSRWRASQRELGRDLADRILELPSWPHPLVQQILLASAAAVLAGILLLIWRTDMDTGTLNTATNYAIGLSIVCLLPLLAVLLMFVVAVAIAVAAVAAVIAIIGLFISAGSG